MPPTQLPFQTRGTNTSAPIGQVEQADNIMKRQQCLAQGGKWDGNTCIFTAEQSIAQSVASNQPKPKTDTPTGPPPTDDPVLKFAREEGLSLKQAADILQARSQQSPAKQAVRQSVATQNAEGVQREQVQAQLQRAQEFQNTQDVQPSFQEPGSQVNVANEIGLAAAMAGGAAGGAQLGAALTPILGPLGIIGGGIVGAIGGAITVLKLDEKQNVKKGNKIFTTSKTNKEKILNQINAGLMTETAARQAWAQEKANIALSQSYLKKVTNDDLKEFLGNPGDELIAVESYLELDEMYDFAFENALLNPDASKIIQITTPQET